MSWLLVNGHVCKDLRPASSRHLLLTYVTTEVNYICCGEYSRLLHGIFAEEVWRDTFKIKNCYKLLSAEVKLLFYNPVKGKGKAGPLEAWSGPEGSRKLRFPYFMTTAQDGGKVVSLTHRPPSPPGNTPGTHFC